jgi:hypothetical protein
VDDASEGRRPFATLPRMSIEMHAAEVYRLADTLRGAAEDVEDIGACLRAPSGVDGHLTAAAGAFLASHRAAAHAFAGELDWLAGTVTDVAHSWLRLDGTLVPRGQLGAE